MNLRYTQYSSSSHTVYYNTSSRCRNSSNFIPFLSVKIWRDSYSLHTRLSWLSQVSQLLMSCSFKTFHLWSHNVHSLFLSPTFYSLYLTSNFTILNSLLAEPCKPTVPFNALWLDLNLLFNSTRLREKYRRSRHKTSLQMSPPGFKTSSNPFYLAENDS